MVSCLLIFIPLGIGDGQNDIELLQEVGYGIALNNAPKILKDVADYVAEKSSAKDSLKQL